VWLKRKIFVSEAEGSHGSFCSETLS